MSSIEQSPARRARVAKRRRREERSWAERSGPVVIIKPAAPQE